MFIVTTITKRPEGVKWFGEVDKESRLAISAERKNKTNAGTGPIKTKTHKLSKNKTKIVNVFNSQEDYEAYKIAMEAMPEYKALEKYTADNNIKVITRKFLEVK